jgi:WD40 repeat protein
MKLSCRFQHDSWVANVAFSPDSKCLYTLTGKNGTLSQWDIKKKNLTYSRSVHLDQTRGLDISKSGKRVAISCKDGTFSYFDPTDEKSIIWPIKISDVELRKIRIGVTEIIATGNSKGEIFLIDFRKPKKGQIKRIHLDISEEMIRGLSFNSKGTFLAFTNSGGFVKILNLRTNCYFSVKAHNGHAIAVGFSPNDQFIVTGGQDNIICVWKFKKGKLRKSLEFHGHTDSVTALVFDKNKRLYSSSRDGTIRVWNLSGLY